MWDVFDRHFQAGVLREIFFSGKTFAWNASKTRLRNSQGRKGWRADFLKIGHPPEDLWHLSCPVDVFWWIKGREVLKVVLTALDLDVLRWATRGGSKTLVNILGVGDRPKGSAKTAASDDAITSKNVKRGFGVTSPRTSPRPLAACVVARASGALCLYILFFPLRRAWHRRMYM